MLTKIFATHASNVQLQDSVHVSRYLYKEEHKKYGTAHVSNESCPNVDRSKDSFPRYFDILEHRIRQKICNSL